MDEIILTDRGRVVLQYMQTHDEIIVGKDLGEIMNIKGNGIYPVLLSLIRNGLVKECESIIRDFTNSKGETKPKEYKTYSLTDIGRMFNPED